MSTDQHRVSLSISGKEFLVACPPEARDELLEAAADLNRRMSEIRNRGKVIGLERIAVIAALNLSHELMQERRRRTELESALERLESRLEQALAAPEQRASVTPFPAKDQD